MCPKLSRGHFPLDRAKRVSMSQELTCVGTGKKNGDKMPEPYIEPSVAVVAYGLALVAISLKCPRTHCSFTPCPRIPRTEYPERNLGAPLLEARAPLDLVRLPGMCFRVARDQELRAARELAEAHVPRPVLH